MAAPAFQLVMLPLKSLVQMASLDCSTMAASSWFFDSLLTEGGNQVLDVVRHVIERLGRRAHLGRAFGFDAHRMVAPAEAIGAVGKHAQRSQVAAEYQPDELQHEEQRDKHDLQLLDELRPQPVSALTGVILTWSDPYPTPPASTA